MFCYSLMDNLYGKVTRIYIHTHIYMYVCIYMNCRWAKEERSFWHPYFRGRRERERDGNKELSEGSFSVHSHGCCRVYERRFNYSIQGSNIQRLEQLCLSPIHLCYCHPCSPPLSLCLPQVISLLILCFSINHTYVL